MAKFLWEHPPYPRLNSRARYFVCTWGLYTSVSRKNFSVPWPPRGRYGGSKNFLPPSKFRRQTPSKLCNYVGLCVPYKPWKFGDGLPATFFSRPIWKYGTPVWAIRVQILDSGVNSRYFFTTNYILSYKVVYIRTLYILFDASVETVT